MIIKVPPVSGDWVIPKISRKFEEIFPKGDGQGKKIIFYSLYNMVPEKRLDNELRVAIFTHDTRNGEFLKFAKRCDYIICLAPQYERYLRSKGFSNVKTLPLPPESQFECKLVLAWVGHFFNRHRKGYKLYDKIKLIPWVKLIHPDHVPFEELPDAYERCDYVVCTSCMEGGPLSLVEGLACGKKMIMPLNVGTAELFKEGIIPYKNSDWEDLLRVLKELYAEKKKIADIVKDLTWENFANEIEKVFEEMDKW